MVDDCISLAKLDPIVAKKSLKTSAIYAAEEIGSLFTLLFRKYFAICHICVNLGRQSASTFFEDSFHSLKLFLCRFNGIVYFVSSLLTSLPSRRATFLNSNFLHVIPFICNPRGVLIGEPFFWTVTCLSTTSINKFFETSHIVSGFVSEMILFHNRLTETCSLRLACISSILDIHILINWQLSKQGIRWPVSRDHIPGSNLQLIEVM